MRNWLTVPFILGGVWFASAATAADMSVKSESAPPYAANTWLDVFGGLTVAPHSVFAYAGGLISLNRHSGTDGFFVRLDGGTGRYDYRRAPGLKQSVNFQTGELAVGYQAYLGQVRIAGSVGANVEDHDNSDPLARVAGSRWGVKGQGEMFAPLGSSAYVFLLGNYSSVWNSYLFISKLGYRLTDSVSIGPEAMALGNVRYDSLRVGPFVSFAIARNAEIVLSGGYSRDMRRNALNDTSGGYGNLYLRVSF